MAARMQTPEHRDAVEALFRMSGEELGEAAVIGGEADRYDLPHVHELALLDNSRGVDLSGGEAPRPEKLLHIRDGEIEYVADHRTAPAWAKSINQAALSA